MRANCGVSITDWNISKTEIFQQRVATDPLIAAQGILRYACLVQFQARIYLRKFVSAPLNNGFRSLQRYFGLLPLDYEERHYAIEKQNQRICVRDSQRSHVRSPAILRYIFHVGTAQMRPDTAFDQEVRNLEQHAILFRGLHEGDFGGPRFLLVTNVSFAIEETRYICPGHRRLLYAI